MCCFYPNIPVPAGVLDTGLVGGRPGRVPGLGGHPALLDMPPRPGWPNSGLWSTARKGSQGLGTVGAAVPVGANSFSTWLCLIAPTELGGRGSERP